MSERRSIAARLTYRQSAPADLSAIGSVEAASYGGAHGHGLSEALVTSPVDTLSFVAAHENDIIGHVLLTRIDGPARAMALAPLAVLPSWRDMQIGTGLVRHALARARDAGWQVVFVYGQPDFYGRFGFKSHLADGAEVDWQGPRFLALELKKGALAGWNGPLDYPQAYRAVADVIHR